MSKYETEPLSRRQAIKLTLAATAVASSGLAASTGKALAQSYPTKQLNWVVMWSAGGGADTATRIFTKHLEKELGQTIVVRNVTGGGGSIGYMTGKQSASDGYNLITIQGDLPKFKPMELAPIQIDDFDVISGFASQSPTLITQADSPWKTLGDFIADAKANPGKRTIGVSDIGGVHHQPVVLLAEQAGIDVRAIAHDGSPQMNAAILGGHVDVISSYIRPAAPYVNEGKLRFLGTFAGSSPAAYPDVPTVKSMGYDVVWEQPYGMGGPAGMPAESKEVLAAAAAKVREIPEFRQELSKLGLDVYEKDGADFRDALISMQVGITKVVSTLRAQ